MNLFALVNGSPWFFGPVTFSGSITFAGSALLADGSAAAPALAFAADTDTGIYRPGANELAFVTGGTERASFISQGLKLSNVGGGFTNPNVFANGDNDTGLAVIGGNSLALVVGGTTALCFNGSANVLIGGTIDGGQKLQVNGTAAISGNTTLGSGNAYPIYAYSGYFQFATATSGNFASVGPNRAHSGTMSDGISIQTYNGYAWSESAYFTKTSVNLLTNSTTALTLDSSQRCILAGALRLNNAYTASAVVPTGYVTIQDSTGTTYKVCVLL